jgi:flagellar hook capping protein FlgD
MKKILITLSIVLVCLVLSASNEYSIFDISPNARINGNTTPNDDMWDINTVFNTSANSMPGIETDGTNIYSTTWNSNTFSRYDMDGVHQADFTISDVSNIRDMAYDGSHFYGGSVAMTIYIMDLANENLEGTISVNCSGITGVRHIAYDPELDNGNGGFWIGNWNELGAIKMDGSQIYPYIPDVSSSCYGSAYDEWTEGGPYLWLFFQNGSGAEIHQFEIATQSLTNVMHDATDIPGYEPGSIAGGLASYYSNAGDFILIANIQQDPNLVGLYELVAIGDPSRPGIPTNVNAIANEDGLLEATIEWTCPDLNVIGGSLTELLEMRVYRDEILVYTDINPTIGQQGSYLDDQITNSGMYVYRIAGYNQFGEGVSDQVELWIGEDVPAAVSGLLAESVSGCGYVTWINPSTGLNSGPYNNPVQGYHITRLPDNTLFEINERDSIFIDNTLPAVEFYSYSVVPYNLIGDGEVATSDSTFIGLGTDVFIDDFEEGMNNWTVTNNGGTGQWDLYSEPFANVYTLPATSSGNVCAADADIAGNSTLTTLELATGLDLSTYESVFLQFDSDWKANNGDDYCYVDVSNDAGSTWHNVLTYNGEDVRSTHEMVNITDYAALQSNVLIRFESVQPAWDYWWVLDNIVVTYYTLNFYNPELDPPENLAIESDPEDDFALFTWEAPGSGLSDFELLQHDGNAINAYSQSYGDVYGVVYDVSAYTNVTLEMVDFRHSSWGLTGIWDYSLHIVDWDTQTEIAVVEDLQTTVDDNWEEGIDLGSVSASGLVGIFLEPLGNNPADAYPCLDADGIGPDGMSYYGQLPDYSTLTLSGIGDFLMELWISGIETDNIVKAPTVIAEFGTAESRVASILPTFNSFIPQQTARELMGYNVFLDNELLGNTDDFEWEIAGLDSSIVYLAGVEAVYDDGISDMMTIEFTYVGRTDASSILPLMTSLIGNYPNPFNPITKIDFSIQQAGRVQLQVYNVKGQLVRTLLDEKMEPNLHKVVWDGKSDKGKSVSSGVYFYKLQTKDYVLSKKMILLK